jgi:hypothetical protein
MIKRHLPNGRIGAVEEAIGGEVNDHIFVRKEFVWGKEYLCGVLNPVEELLHQDVEDPQEDLAKELSGQMMKNTDAELADRRGRKRKRRSVGLQDAYEFVRKTVDHTPMYVVV